MRSSAGLNFHALSELEDNAEGLQKGLDRLVAYQAEMF